MIDDNDVTTSEFEGEQKPTETTVQSEAAKEDKGLSNREAAKQALEKHRPEIKFEKKDSPEPAKKEIAAALEAEIEPPAGFNKQEIEAWKAKDIAGIQKGFKRVHDAKTQEMSRAQTERDKAKEEAAKEREEAKTWREFGALAGPYIEAQGMKGVTPQQAMMNALNLIVAFQKADPQTAKAELKALGIDLDKAPAEQTANVPKELLDKIEGLQKWKSDTESLLEQRRFQGVVENYKKAYEALDAQKTRAGEKVFPDLFDEQFCSTNEGKLFHSELGSLTKDPIFIKGVFRRFPEADFTTVCREAYIALGGKVAGAPVTVSSNNQNDLYKKSRAAASSPGKPAARVDTASLKGKLGRRAAAKKALEIHGWEN